MNFYANIIRRNNIQKISSSADINTIKNVFNSAGTIGLVASDAIITDKNDVGNGVDAVVQGPFTKANLATINHTIMIFEKNNDEYKILIFCPVQ